MAQTNVWNWVSYNNKNPQNYTVAEDTPSVELSSESAFWWLRRSKRITDPREWPPRDTGPLKPGLRLQYSA